MIEEYYVNLDTLLLVPVSKSKTKIFDIAGTNYIKKPIFNVVDESCQYYGSSYGGRYTGAKRMLEMNYKLPIIMDEVKEVILFPTCSPRKDYCFWICLNNIESYEKSKNGTIIKFTNGFTYEVNVSELSLENQILRATLLMMKLKKRKSNPKKIGK